MTPQRDKQAFDLAKEFLLAEMRKQGIEAAVLEKYLHTAHFTSLDEVYLRLIKSGANRNRVANIIRSGTQGGVQNLSGILFDFNPHLVKKAYSQDHQLLLSKILETFNLQVNRNAKGIWPKFARTILEGAQFLDQFESYTDFDEFIDYFYRHERARPALPLYIGKEIYGFGTALACDFLKESGWQEYGKPDVILTRFFKEGKLVEKDDDYNVMQAIVRVARHNNITPYAVDKVFWLIGSGKFNMDADPNTGKDIKLKGPKRRKERFLQLLATLP